jgi:hypothetical protein
LKIKSIRLGKMSRFPLVLLLFSLILLSECGAMKEVLKPEASKLQGMDGLVQSCYDSDTVQNILIKKAEAILTYDKERYEVNVTLYSKRDSIIYLSAVNSGYEILRASVKHDSIKVIDRMNKIVYSAPLQRKFGYQYPVNFHDLQNLIASFYLCDDLQLGSDDHQNNILFEFDENYIKKRISLNRVDLHMNIFEFYHQKTDRYLMGERLEDAFKIYSNFMITEIEIVARGGERTINRDIKIKMEVNPRKYTFTELR